MIHSERIVRVTRQYLLEVLNRRIVVEVVIVFESCLVQRIGWVERGRNWRFRCQTNVGKDERGKKQEVPGEVS